MSWWGNCKTWVSSAVDTAKRVTSYTAATVVDTWKKRPLTQLWRVIYTTSATAAMTLVELGMIELLTTEAACDINAMASGTAPISDEFETIVTPMSYAAVALCTTMFVVPRILSNWEKSDPATWFSKKKPLLPQVVLPGDSEDTPTEALDHSSESDSNNKSTYCSYKTAVALVFWGAYAVTFASGRIKNYTGSTNAIDVFVPLDTTTALAISIASTGLLGLSSVFFNTAEFKDGLREVKRHPVNLFKSIINDAVGVCTGLQTAEWVRRFMASEMSITSNQILPIQIASAASSSLVSMLTNMKSSSEISNNVSYMRQHPLILGSMSIYFSIWIVLNTYLLKKSAMEFSYPHMAHHSPESSSLSDRCAAIAMNTDDQHMVQYGIYAAAIPFGIVYSVVYSGFLLKKWMGLAKKWKKLVEKDSVDWQNALDATQDEVENLLSDSSQESNLPSAPLLDEGLASAYDSGVHSPALFVRNDRSQSCDLPSANKQATESRPRSR